jgi:hypothetical protein
MTKTEVQHPVKIVKIRMLQPFADAILAAAI